MKKFLLALAGAAGAVYYLTKKVRSASRRIMFNEELAVLTDWKDEFHFRVNDETDLKKRFLPFKSAVNMRDIGGYTNENGQQIKWNKIYRGEELTHLSKEDEEKFSKLGITHIFDLRNRDTAEKEPGFLPEGVVYTNIPVLEGLRKDCLDLSYPNFVDQFMRNIYMELVEKRGDLFCEVLKVLADEPDAVIYIHCTNGKDRTGFMIALIMMLAGVGRENTLSDYSLSNYHVDRAYRLFDSDLIEELGYKNAELYYGTIGVDPNWLDIQLNYIKNNYSEVEEYILRNSTLTKYDLANIRENILEPVKVNKKETKKD